MLACGSDLLNPRVIKGFASSAMLLKSFSSYRLNEPSVPPVTSFDLPFLQSSLCVVIGFMVLLVDSPPVCGHLG